MAAVNAEVLKKHHFWVLFLAVPVLVLVATAVVSGGVGGAITEKQKAVDAAEKDLQGKSPKTEGMYAELERQKGLLFKTRETLWKFNWDQQKARFTWPQSPKLKEVEKLDLKFGDRIPNPNQEYDEFKKDEVYAAEYRRLAESMAPTQFAGGWQGVFRHVSDWGVRQPTAAQLWLALEDLWVQRAIVDALKSVNDKVARFDRVTAPGQADQPLKRTFRSRLWEVDLEVVRQGNGQRIKGKVTNRTDRLQLLGVGNTMRLKVWLDKHPEAEPVEFPVEGEFVRAGASLDVKELPRHVVVPGTAVTEIARVEQVFDARTVPIRRIDRIALNYPDARHATATLKPPPFFAPPPYAAAAGAIDPTAPPPEGG